MQLDSVTLKFGHRTIFKDLSLDFPKGQCTVILGNSGVGKTSILGLLSGQIRATSGCVLVDGIDLGTCSRRALRQIRLKLGYLYQQGGLLSHLSVFENVAFPLRYHHKLPERVLENLVLMRLDAVGLLSARDLPIESLSGGMKQRTAFARATIMDPERIMYDEPFSGQDPVSKQILIQLIQAQSRQKEVTTLLVSHDIDESFQVADRVIVLLKDGTRVTGTKEEIMHHQDARVVDFLAGVPPNRSDDQRLIAKLGLE